MFSQDADNDVRGQIGKNTTKAVKERRCVSGEISDLVCSSTITCDLHPRFFYILGYQISSHGAAYVL
tara:strand:- start:1495 stop:1695 length:201 start_codon:yes stop_codon:yes gene_type:complete